MTLEEQTRSRLELSIICQLAVEKLDDLKDSLLVKTSSLKHQFTKIEKGIKPHLSIYDGMLNDDPQMALNLSQQMEIIINRLAKASMTEICQMNAMFDYYDTNKEECKEKFPIYFNKLG
jgi:hypothetical protein